MIIRIYSKALEYDLIVSYNKKSTMNDNNGCFI